MGIIISVDSSYNINLRYLITMSLTSHSNRILPFVILLLAIFNSCVKLLLIQLSPFSVSLQNELASYYHYLIVDFDTLYLQTSESRRFIQTSTFILKF